MFVQRSQHNNIMTKLQSIVLATSNKGKIKDFQKLNNNKFNLIPQQELNVVDTNETGLSFIENAILKARGASKQANMPAIADDSGLVVDYLGGAPGIYSARYAGDKSNSSDNIKKLLTNMQKAKGKDRSAYFYCAIVMVLSSDSPTPIIAQGKWHGSIADKCYGDNGFGYDPIFYPDNYSITSAQMSIDYKNTISHRAIALNKLFNILRPLHKHE